MSAGKDDLSHERFVGQVIDKKYRVVRFLAKGGMGAVYEGLQLEPLERQVAIKVLYTEADDPLFRRRFFNEAAMCASLSHPNVVRVFDYGVTDERVCYIVMELLHGEPLSAMLKRERRLDPELALQVIADICSALMEAHGKGFVHRDLKPSNLFVVDRSYRGLFIKVLDFGLAKRMQIDNHLTQTGTVLGSPHFMSPEQIQDTEVGPQTDIYNLGLILFRMLTGQLAFRSDAASAVLVAQATRPPPSFAEVAPDLKPMPEIEWVVQACLRKKPADRFANAEELVKAVEACLMLVQGKLPSLIMDLREGLLYLPEGVELPSQLQARILRTQSVQEPVDEASRVRTATVVTAIALGAGATGSAIVVIAAALLAWFMLR